MSDPLYAVILKKQEDLRPMEIARAMADIRRVPLQDAVASAKSCWGILSDGLEEAPAKELARRLGEARLDALAVPRQLLEDAPAARPVARLQVEESHLAAAPGEHIRRGPRERSYSLPAASDSDGWERIPWNRLALAAVAGFRRITSRTATVTEGPDMGQKLMGLGIMMVTGLPVGMGGKKREVAKTVESSEVVYFMDLCLREPDGSLRIDAQNFDYSCLGEKMGYESLGNLRTLADALARRAPQALLNRGTRVLLEKRPFREMGYESLRDLERESRWLMTLRALKLI